MPRGNEAERQRDRLEGGCMKGRVISNVGSMEGAHGADATVPPHLRGRAKWCVRARDREAEGEERCGGRMVGGWEGNDLGV